MGLTVDNCKEVYFSTITSLCEEGKKDILNLAAKLDKAIFSVWIQPPDSDGAEWHFGDKKLKCQGNMLLMDNIILASLPLRTALLMFHAFLKSSPLPVLLVSHSPDTVSEVLLGAIKRAELLDLFQGVIAGFVNLLPIWKKNCPERKKKGDFRLSVLSQDFLGQKYSMAPYNTTDYLLVLSKLADKISSKSQFIENRECYDTPMKTMEKSEDSLCYRGSEPLLSVVSRHDLIKMARAGLSYRTLKKIFLSKGSTGLTNFLAAKSISQRLHLFQDVDSILNIVRFFEKQFSY